MTTNIIALVIACGMAPLCTFAETPSTTPAPPFDCLTLQLKYLVSYQKIEERLSQSLKSATATEVQTELNAIVEHFSETHPEFQKQEFLSWMEKNPLSSSELDLAKKINSTYADVLNYRYYTQRLEKEASVEARKFSKEFRGVVETCEKNGACREKAASGFIQKNFGCLAKSKTARLSLLSALLVHNASYAYITATTGDDFSWDLSLTNAFWGPILIEQACKMANGAKDDSTAPLKERYKNYFLGVADKNGVRPGLAKKVGKMAWFYVKSSLPYAGTYTIFHAGEGVARGKKLTFDKISTIPEDERKNYVSLNPGSVLKNSAVMLITYDLPFGIPRQVFLADHLSMIALPALLKNKSLTMVADIGSRVVLTTFSTHVFRCWEKNDQSYNSGFWSCFWKEAKKNPEIKIKTIVIPEEGDRKPASDTTPVPITIDPPSED